ncbi:MAG: FkbM family methyltransferase [Vicinamibacterales bacterium]
MSARRRTALVTCIYNGLHGTPYGGRQNRDADYAASLATIAGCGLPVACFVDPGALAAHAKMFRATAPNVALHPLALADVPGSAAVQRVKRERPADFAGIEWRERCVEIMWGKFHMLRRVLSASAAVTHAYWIDAGLANVNIVSTKYSSLAALQARRYSDVARAFPSVLFDRMSEFAGDRVVALKCTCPHNRGIPDTYNLRPYADGDGLVGGLFGGRREAVLTLCDRFDAKVAALLGDGQVHFEESILTGIHADCPDLFRCFTFDSWYHEGWAAYDPDRRPFSTFFDVMLQTPASWPAPRFPWEEPSPEPGLPPDATAVPAPAADDVGDPGDGDDLFDQALHRLGLAFADPYFVQIGAMDGVSFDDFHGYVRMYGWAGLLVEPVPWQFERLKAAYASLPGGATRYAFEPAAVAAHDGTVDMLVIDRAAVDDGRVAPCFGGMSAIWPPRNGLASDGDAAVVRAFGRRLTVPCLTLPTLLARHGVGRLDILCIDAEGWDFAILRQLDVEHLRPAVIRCEWINLDAGERQAALDWLRARGYVARVAGQNLDAVDRTFWQVLKSGEGIAPGAGTAAAGDMTLVTAVEPASGRRGEAVETMARHVGALAASGRPVVAFVDDALLARCQEAAGHRHVRWIGREAGTMGVASGGPATGAASGDAGRARSSSRGPALAAGGVLLLHDAAVMNPFGARWLLWVPPVVMASGAALVGESVTRWQAQLARDLRYHVMDLSRAPDGRGAGAEARVLGGTVRAIRAVNPRYCALIAAQGPEADGGPALDALAAACPGLVRAGREAPLASMPS